MNIKPGDIYSNSYQKYFLILACDEIQVFYYGFYWPENHPLDANKIHFKMDYDYYGFVGTTSKYFLKTHTYVASKELTSKEKELLRPDLPLMNGRSKLLSWKAINQMSSPRELYPYGEDFKKILAVDAVYIEPYGSRGGYKTPKLIEPGKEKPMDVAYIMWAAAKYQVKVFEDDRFGVGIYRLGIKNNKPSYSLWGYHTKTRWSLYNDLGSQDHFTTIGIKWSQLKKNSVAVKKEKGSLYKFKIINNEISLIGSTLRLYLMWHPEPVMSFKLSSIQFSLDLSDFPPGPYFILIPNSKDDTYIYWDEYHLIRDDHDGWVYIYPDMKNITKYTKKVEVSKKLEIPQIRSNANMSKYEKKFKELFADDTIPHRGEIVDMEEHGYRLHYFDLNERDSHYDLLSEKGFQGGGPTWHGIVSGAIELTDPTLSNEIYMDEDSEGIIVSSKNRKVLEKIGRLIAILKSNPELLAAAIHVAEKREMID